MTALTILGVLIRTPLKRSIREMTYGQYTEVSRLGM